MVLFAKSSTQNDLMSFKIVKLFFYRWNDPESTVSLSPKEKSDHSQYFIALVKKDIVQLKLHFKMM